MANHVRDGAVTQQAHPDHKPHHRLRRQLAASDRRRPAALKRLSNPRSVEIRRERFETVVDTFFGEVVKS
jgi:hypothetical protein